MPTPARAGLVIAFIYLFLVGVSSLETGIKMMGADTQERLFSTVSNPLAGLFVGILATVLVQSSSASTSIIVGLVASGAVSRRGGPDDHGRQHRHHGDQHARLARPRPSDRGVHAGRSPPRPSTTSSTCSPWRSCCRSSCHGRLSTVATWISELPGRIGGRRVGEPRQGRRDLAGRVRSDLGDAVGLASTGNVLGPVMVGRGSS
jgi:hypothetical protein